jgi:hypothetical protein
MKTKAPGSPARTSRRNSRSTSCNLPPESMSSASVPTRYACSGAQHQLSFSGRAQQPEPESSINGAIPTRRLEIVRIIAKRKAHLRRERLDDACDRCNPAELTRDENGGLEGVREPHAGRRIRPFPTLWSLRSEPEGSIKGSTGTAYWRSCKSSPNKKRQFAALLQSPLMDSNRRPPPYHGGSEAVTAYTRGHPRSRLSCKSGSQRVSAVSARDRACSN